MNRGLTCLFSWKKLYIEERERDKKEKIRDKQLTSKTSNNSSLIQKVLGYEREASLLVARIWNVGALAGGGFTSPGC